MGERFNYLAEGDRSIEKLVATYGNALVRYAFCHTGNYAAAEDIAEDAFVALLLKPRKFPDEHRLRAYLYKTVTNKCVDYHRSKTRACVPLDDVENVLYDDASLKQIDGDLDNRTLYRAMQALPAQYRETLCLCYFDGFSPAEIAKIMRISKKQVYNVLARAKTSLSKLLNKEGK